MQNKLMQFLNSSGYSEHEAREVTEPERARLYLMTEAIARVDETPQHGNIVANRAFEQKIKGLEHSADEIPSTETTLPSRASDTESSNVTDLNEYHAKRDKEQKAMEDDARDLIDRLAA